MPLLPILQSAPALILDSLTQGQGRPCPWWPC